MRFLDMKTVEAMHETCSHVFPTTMVTGHVILRQEINGEVTNLT